MMTNNNPYYMLIAYDGDYPEKGGIATLVGLYKTEEQAEFIKRVVENRYPYSEYKIKQLTNKRYSEK